MFARLSKIPWVVVAFAVSLVACVAFFPPNMLANDQEKPAGYVADILQNNTWLVQRDQTGDIASKPLLHPVLAAVAVIAVGRSKAGIYEQWPLEIPSLLAVLLTGVLIYARGRRFWGAEAGVVAAVALLGSSPAIRMAGLIRTDPLFMLAVAAGAMAAFDAWTGRASWWRYWGWALLATLIKGPLGAVLAALGLLAVVTVPRGERPAWQGRGILWGALVFLLVGGAWFGLACWSEGPEVYRKMVMKELVGHSTAGTEADRGGGVYSPWLFFLPRYLPWSFLALWAIVQSFRRPSGDVTTRLFERFLVVWFLGGMLVFMLAKHYRMDLLYPLLPAVALLIGGRLAMGIPRHAVMVSAVIGVIVHGAYATVAFTGKEERMRAQETATARQVALEVLRRNEGHGQGQPPLVISRTLQAVQYHLGINLWRTADNDAVVLRALQSGLRTMGLVHAEELAELRSALGDGLRVRRVWNRSDGKPWLALVDSVTTGPALRGFVTSAGRGPLLAEGYDAHLRWASRTGVSLVAAAPSARVVVSNMTSATSALRVEWWGSGLAAERIFVGAGATAVLSAPAGATGQAGGDTRRVVCCFVAVGLLVLALGWAREVLRA